MAVCSEELFWIGIKDNLKLVFPKSVKIQKPLLITFTRK